VNISIKNSDKHILNHFLAIQLQCYLNWWSAFGPLVAYQSRLNVGSGTIEPVHSLRRRGAGWSSRQAELKEPVTEQSTELEEHRKWFWGGWVFVLYAYTLAVSVVEDIEQGSFIFLIWVIIEFGQQFKSNCINDHNVNLCFTGFIRGDTAVD
jgi:hypothetical protein